MCMPEPVTLALGVAVGKLLFRWADLNDTADALEDAHAGFDALRALGLKRVQKPVGTAITDVLEHRLLGVRDMGRREQMRIAVGNVATVFSGLSDDDIRAAAQHPTGFPDYLARGPGNVLLRQTEEALTPFTRRLMDAGAEVFAELAPRSGRFTSGALIRLLDQVEAATVSVAGLRAELAAARAELVAATNRVGERVEELHPKVDRILQATERTSIPDAAVKVSLRALATGVVLGPPVGQWATGRAGGLGVNASITVHDETTLTPYLARAHDQQLRDTLHALTTPGASSQLLLVVGNSCVGKTRTLYEAVQAVLPDWQLVAPPTDTDLARLLTIGGVPARTVVWLDELQNKLTKLGDGVNAAKAISALLSATEVGPFLVAGTIWPHELNNLTQRPTPEEAAAGAASIRDLLSQATTFPVPDTFTDADLANAPNDARLKIAITTATPISHPEHGRKLTQVLAGGTQLVHRLHCDPSRPGAFSPAAQPTPTLGSRRSNPGIPRRPSTIPRVTLVPNRPRPTHHSLLARRHFHRHPHPRYPRRRRPRSHPHPAHHHRRRPDRGLHPA